MTINLVSIHQSWFLDRAWPRSCHGMQVYGAMVHQRMGYGAIVMMPVFTLYEGTTGVQALDLIGRKVLLSSKVK